MLLVALSVLAIHAPPADKLPVWLAYAINWWAPVLLAGICVWRFVLKDYWGVAFFLVIEGFALVNALYLEPSPRRTALFRALTGLFVVVSIAAIWKSMWP